MIKYIVNEFQKLKQKNARLITIVGVNRGSDVHVIYYFFLNNKIKSIEKKVENDEIKSIVNFFPNADFYERETGEMFGIRFKGHPNQELLFLTKELADKKILRKK